MNALRPLVSVSKKRFVLCLVALSFPFLLFSAHSVGFAATKEEVLEKYNQVIVRSNQMVMYGYDLQEVTYKLKHMTTVLLDNRFDQAEALLDEIEKNLKVIESKGPAYLQRERKLTWLEIYGDLVQQAAFLLVTVFFLFRFAFLKKIMLLARPGRLHGWYAVLIFSFTSVFLATIGVIRYGQSAWSFVDLQVLLIGISALLAWWVF